LQQQQQRNDARAERQQRYTQGGAQWLVKQVFEYDFE
jgi:hypothetical protein